MNIESWYSKIFESNLKGRFIALQHILPLMDFYKNTFSISIAGKSESDREIHLVKIGKGKKVVLAWSQMHGNESTTTKAIFDFLRFLDQNEAFQSDISDFLKKYTLYIIPILNPDGAALYSRENSNLVDLNRDAKDLTQKESRILNGLFNELRPDLCLNLHDQRSIFGLVTGEPAYISFLSPAVDKERRLTDSRISTMEMIVKMNNTLQKIIPGKVGRYDDTYNQACVGDTFQKAGVPTILFEAGHINNDYQRERSREYIFYALLSLFDIIKGVDPNHKEYFNIPKNTKNFRDVVLRDAKLVDTTKTCSISIQYEELLDDGILRFVPKLDAIGELDGLKGHIEINVEGDEILLNSQNIIKIGDEILRINKKKDDSLIYFDENTFKA